MANYQHYRSPFGDTTFTKVFVGGLAWETPTEEMRTYFQQFGDILEAVIITDKITSKSKGYGFVTFSDPEAAKRACVDPNPVIDGRRANCNIASLGRPRPSPPRGRFQGGGTPQGHGQAAGSAYSGGGSGPLPPPPPPPPPLPPHAIYPSYGYPTYTPHYGYHQQQHGMYSPQIQQQQQQQQHYYNQMHGASSSNMMGSPYYYGYSMQTGASRGPYPPSPQGQRMQGPSPYVYYPAPPQIDPPSLSPYPPPPAPLLQLPTTRHSFPPSPSDTLTIAQRTSTDSEAQGSGASQGSQS